MASFGWLWAAARTHFLVIQCPKVINLWDDVGIVPPKEGLLGGSWDLVSKVISALIGVISSYKYSYPIYNPSYSVP